MEDRVEELIGLFTMKSHYQFEDFFFTADQSRAMLIITFVAILEMVKLGLIRVKQSSPVDLIYCHASDEFQQHVAKWYEHHHPVNELSIA